MFKKLMTCFTVAAVLLGCATPRGEATRSAIDEALNEAITLYDAHCSAPVLGSGTWVPPAADSTQLEDS